MQITGNNTSLNTLLILAAFVIIVAGMKVASPILVPVLLATFIATISAPPLLWLERRGLPTVLALLTVIAVILSVGLLVATLMGKSLAEFQSQLPIYEARLENLFAVLNSTAAQFEIEIRFSDIASFINPNSIATGVGRVVNELGGLIANAFLIFLMVIFILFEVSTLPKKLERIIAKPVDSMERLSQFKRNLQRYLVIKTLTSMATAALVFGLLEFFGVDFSVLWAVLAFFLNFVPNIGSIIAALPAVLITLLQIDLATATWVAVGYLVINNVVGTVIEPRIAGRHLGLSPMVVFMSLIFWGWILGPVGMFLSVPLTMMVRLVAESSDNARWISVLLSDRISD